MSGKSLAFNSERLRQLLWQRVAPPPEMLQNAINKLNEQLEATETKFFTNEGLVVGREEVPAHAIQQNAANAILKMSDAFPRDRVDKAGPPSVTLEIKDGVFRLHIGAVGSSGEEVAYDPNELNGVEQQTTINTSTTERSALALEAHQQPFMAPPSPPEEVEEPPTQVIRMKDYKNRQEALRILMQDDGQTK